MEARDDAVNDGERERERENINEGKIHNYVINCFFYFVLFLIKNVKLD